MKRIGMGMALLWASLPALAQNSPRGTYVWERYGERIAASQAVAPLGDDLFGDRISLSKGQVSFAVTDIELKSHTGPSLAIERNYLVKDRWEKQTEGMLADWDLNLPSLSATFNPDWVLRRNTLTPLIAERCSVNAAPPWYFNIDPKEFWQGISLNLPGYETNKIFRTDNSAGLSDGRTYPWISGSGKTRLACLPNIKNGAGEGFLAITADGTRYWFDWMAQVQDTILQSPAYVIWQYPNVVINGVMLKTNTLYATRIEDRFGNRIDFTYTNAWNQPARLTQIQASDGRSITLAYSGNFVSSITDGTRTWYYNYSSTPSNRTTLNQVRRPDGSAWQINFYDLTQNGEIRYREDHMPTDIERNCAWLSAMPTNLGKTFAGIITHPSGAVGAFTFNMQEHGRSHVPVSCRNVTTIIGNPRGSGNNPNDDVNLWATRAYGLTLIKKRITGPGVASSEWNYSYEPNTSTYRYPGTTLKYPVCDWSNYNCSVPPCVSDDCAKSSRTTVTGPGNEWVRYSHGNTFRYNEGKLLKVERGTSESNILQTESYHYDFSFEDKIYPASFGDEGGGEGDFAEAYHRPLLRSEIVRDKTRFIYQVDEFDRYARPIKTTSASMPAP